MSYVRPSAVDGAFYPFDAETIKKDIAKYMGQAKKFDLPSPKAIVVPHAGYVYSAPVAATAYKLIEKSADKIKKVILFGPSHRVSFKGVAMTEASAYATPLGNIEIDYEAVNSVLELPFTGFLDKAHGEEHSLEVQLPFLKEIIKDFIFLPIVTGDASVEEVSAVIEKVWGGEETLIVISTDLSHYLPYEKCRTVDDETRKAVENFDVNGIEHDCACGRIPLTGMMLSAKNRNMTVKTLDIRNSGDTAGSKDQVVGYGSWAFFE